VVGRNQRVGDRRVLEGVILLSRRGLSYGGRCGRGDFLNIFRNGRAAAGNVACALFGFFGTGCADIDGERLFVLFWCVGSGGDSLAKNPKSTKRGHHKARSKNCFLLGRGGKGTRDGVGEQGYFVLATFILTFPSEVW